jgi:hypothetical protein
MKKIIEQLKPRYPIMIKNLSLPRKLAIGGFRFLAEEGLLKANTFAVNH